MIAMADTQSSSNEAKQMNHRANSLIENLIALKTHSALTSPFPHQVMSDIQSSKLQLKPAVMAKKSASKAVEFKDAGNKHFAHKRFDAALLEYTKSLANAEEDSEEAAYAYANRSAALFKMGKYKLCLLEVSRALENGKYPEDKKEKLQARKKRCLVEIIKSTRGCRYRTEFTHCESPWSEEIVAEWRNLCDFGNPLLPSSSIKIKLACDETWGRYTLATEDIKAGEILSCEKFFTSLLSLEMKYEYCSCCFSSCHTLIPCPTCNQDMYCSTSCRTTAFNSYHRVECQVLRFTDLRADLDMDDRMALRMLLIGTDQGTGLKTLMEKLELRDIFAEKIDPTDEPFTNDYLAALKLRRTFSPQFAKYVTKSRLIVKTIIALKKVGYFDNDPDAMQQVQGCQKKDNRRFSESELYAALLFFNHLISVKANTFEVARLENSALGTSVQIGSGICPLHNLINHSCDPNTNTSNRGQEQVLFAVRPISKGEQIFISYSETFASSPKVARTKPLSDPDGNFRFTCQCEACFKSWPMMSVLQLRKPKLSCENKKKAVEDFYDLVVPVAIGGIGALTRSEILEALCQLCKWLRDSTEKPSIYIAKCENLIMCSMTYFYDPFLPENMTESRKRMEIESELKDIVSHVLFSIDP